MELAEYLPPVDLPDGSLLFVEQGNHAGTQPPVNRVQFSACGALVAIHAVKMAHKNCAPAFPEAVLGKGFNFLYGKVFAKILIGLLYPDLQVFDKPGAEWKNTQELFCYAVFGHFSKRKIVAVQTVDLVAVAEHGAVLILPKSFIGTP